MITVKLKRGSGIPTNAQLAEFELGWSVNNKKLYINDGGTVRLAAGALNVSLNGDVAVNEGTLTLFAPNSITGHENQVVRMKSSFVDGEDPFTYVSVDTSPSSDSTSLITSGGVYSGLALKVDKNGTDRLMTAAEGTKLAGIETGAQVNLIETIQIDGVTVSIAGKLVNLTGLEHISNKVTVFSSPTDTQYPSAKLVNDQLALKVPVTKASGGSTSSIINAGSTLDFLHYVTAGTAIKLHMESGQVYLAKYSTGDTPVYSDANKLLNKAEIAAMISGDETRLVTHRSGSIGSYSYGSFPTYADLIAGPWYYGQASESLTNNDYAYVVDDETHDNKQSMYVWDGTVWTFAITFSEDPLVADNSTLEIYDTTNIRVKDSGISTNKIASNAVTTAKIANANVTLAKLISNVGSGNGRIVAYNSSNVAGIINLNNNVEMPTALFAPTESGTTGQYLRANSNGKPTWTNFPNIPSIVLNGVTTLNPNFYAPVSSGTSGQVLLSAGSGSPVWSDIIDGGTWS